ncbi:MAG: chemotaxis protein CheW [Hormoscilla sp.]
MLMLLLYVGNDRYALDISQVVEVVPMVSFRKIYQGPDYLAGWFNYRGQIAPAIDLCQIIKGDESSNCLSTRIIVVNYQSNHNTQHLLGLIAERVTDTINYSETELVATGMETKILGKMIIDDQGTIQTIRVDNLLDSTQLPDLLPGRDKDGTDRY